MPRLPRIPNRQRPAPRAGPSQASQLLALAMAAHQSGRLGDAAALYEQVLKLEPRHVDALHMLGVVASQVGRHESAVELINRALALKPDFAAAHSNRGTILHRLGRLDAALESLDRAIALQPDYVEAHNNRGNLLKDLRRCEAALESFDRAIALKPNYAEAYNNRGNALRELRRYDAALQSYDRAIALRPDYASAYGNRCVVLQDLKEFGAALASADRAIALQPDSPEAHNNRGYVLYALNQFDMALASFDRAIALRPDYVDAYSNRGNALRALARFDEAIASYDAALALQPDSHYARWNKADIELLRGNYPLGWRLYESRWRALSNEEPRDLKRPLWLGGEPLVGKTILVHAEQGFGDVVQFCRYVPLLEARGAKVVLEVPAELMSIVATLSDTITLVAAGDPLPDFDLQCPMMSLPLAFGTNLQTIPAPSHYLASDPRKVEQWRERLGAGTRRRVGFVWSGRAEHPNDRNRSIALGDFARLLSGGAQFVSLQKEVRETDRDALAAHPEVLHFGERLHDFTDTAALCELMDLVVTVDTSVAHLAGALGKPVWILLPLVPDWRWLLGRDDSPWYPSARLYRQARIGAWESVIERVRADLAA